MCQYRSLKRCEGHGDQTLPTQLFNRVEDKGGVIYQPDRASVSSTHSVAHQASALHKLSPPWTTARGALRKVQGEDAEYHLPTAEIMIKFCSPCQIIPDLSGFCTVIFVFGNNAFDLVEPLSRTRSNPSHSKNQIEGRGAR